MYIKFTKKLYTQLLETKIFKYIIGTQLEISTKSTRGFGQPYFQCTNMLSLLFLHCLLWSQIQILHLQKGDSKWDQKD